MNTLQCSLNNPGFAKPGGGADNLMEKQKKKKKEGLAANCHLVPVALLIKS